MIFGTLSLSLSIYIYIYTHTHPSLTSNNPWRLICHLIIEVQDFIHKACTGSAPGMNGISYKFYKNCPCVLRKFTVLLQQVWKNGIVPQEWCLVDQWYLDTKWNVVKRYHKFSSNIPPKCRGKNIFWSSCSPYDNLSDEQSLCNLQSALLWCGTRPMRLEHEQSLYKYICPESWDTWLPQMSGTFTNDMELNTLSQKGQNRTTCNLAWSCQCIQFSSAPLNPNGVVKNEHLTLRPSRAFMDNITILVPSKIAANGLLQRYYDLTWARMKAKPKKSWSLSLVRGSVWEIHFKIGGDMITTVRKKPVKSLGCLYSIPLTDCHRGTEVQKVALKGLRSIDKICLLGNMQAWC